MEQQFKTRLAAIEDERQDVIRKAREQAEADRKAMLAAAETAAQKRREEAARQLETDRTQSIQSLRAELVQIAVVLAERFLHEACNSGLQQQLAGRLVEELAKNPRG